MSTPASPDAPTTAPASGGGSGLHRGLVVALLVIAVLWVLAQMLWTRVDRMTWAFLGAGVACGLLGLAGQGVLSRLAHQPPGDTSRYGLLSWLAFPMALFGTIAMVPLLLLAVYPEARGWLDPHDRILTRMRGAELEIVFSRDMQDGAVNLTFDETPIPPSHFEAFPQHRAWHDLERADDHRVLRVDLPALRREFALDSPRRVGVNAVLADAPQMRLATGERVPQQWVPLPR